MKTVTSWVVRSNEAQQLESHSEFRIDAQQKARLPDPVEIKVGRLSLFQGWVHARPNVPALAHRRIPLNSQHSSTKGNVKD